MKSIFSKGRRDLVVLVGGKSTGWTDSNDSNVWADDEKLFGRETSVGDQSRDGDPTIRGGIRGQQYLSQHLKPHNTLVA